MSRQLPQQETVRQFNKERVYQTKKTAGGATIMNQDNYVEIERLKRIRVDTAQGPYKLMYTDPPPRDNVKVIDADVTR